MPSLRERARVVEEMDRQDADPAKLIRTVRQFRLINRLLSGSHRLIRRYFLRDMMREPAHVHRVLDLGAGGCDIARWVVRSARRRGLAVRITALENDARIAAYARRANRDYPEIRVVSSDARRPEKHGPQDYVFSNHFLHHLDWEQITDTLRRVDGVARRAFIMNDLRRTRLNYLSFRLVALLFFRGGFAPVDGPRSISRGFRVAELREIAARVGGDVRVSPVLPGHLSLYRGPVAGSPAR